jgi:hypothetical protein
MPTYKNRTYINNLDSKLQEALDDLSQQIQNLASQTKANPIGPAPSPNAPAAVSVTATSGQFEATVHDKEAGKFYVLEHSSDPQFKTFNTVDLGVAKNWRAYLGTTLQYFRVRSTHYTGSDSQNVYHGTAQTPKGVQG